MNNSNGSGNGMAGPVDSGDGSEWPPTGIDTSRREPVDEWQATRALLPGERPTRNTTAASPGARAVEAPDAWAATRAHTTLATQIMGDEADYLDGNTEDIGRQIGSNERELFVSCAPAEAMQQQFEHLRPEFLAVHDIATASSRKLLAGIAAASGQAPQKLVIRRQGYGTPLATIEFVELPTTDNRSIRLYSTEADADTVQRHALAKVLLGYSRLGVLMVGELPGHAIAAALKPLHDDILSGPWPNRNLLLLPLTSASNLVAHGLDLGRGTGITVRTTPQVARPADAWAFITGTWSRLREQANSTEVAFPELGAFRPVAYQPSRPPAGPAMGGLPSGDTLPFDDAPPTPLAMRPMPQIAGRSGADNAPPSLLERYVKQVAEISGVVSVCIFDIRSGDAIAHAGANPAAGPLGARGHELIGAMMTASRTLGLGHSTPDAAITLGSHHLLLRGVPRHAGLAIHAVLDKSSANLTLARLQLLRLDSLLDELSPGA